MSRDDERKEERRIFIFAAVLKVRRYRYFQLVPRLSAWHPHPLFPAIPQSRLPRCNPPEIWAAGSI